MNTRIALIMHSPLAAAFAACAQHILGRQPALHLFDIEPDADPDKLVQEVFDWVHLQPRAEPVLMLCDLYGATPFNIAQQVQQKAQADGHVVHLLTGTNICMVLKALTDQQQDPDSFSQRVREGALRGIVHSDHPDLDC